MRKQRHCLMGFIAYSALMLWLLFGRDRFMAPMGYWQQIMENFNAVPLDTICRYLGVLLCDYPADLKRHAVINLVGNVIMFVPLGFFLPNLWKRFRPLWRCLLWGSVIVLCIEMIQLFALVGSCDVDDLILNVLGIGLGYGLCRWRKCSTSRRCVN